MAVDCPALEEHGVAPGPPPPPADESARLAAVRGRLAPAGEALLNMAASLAASRFLQSEQRHVAEQMIPAWKHSQYFLRQPLFLQWQPRTCLPCESPCPIFGRKACGFLRPRRTSRGRVERAEVRWSDEGRGGDKALAGAL